MELPLYHSYYSEVIEINPGFARAYHNLAVVFLSQKKYDLAWENLKKAEDLGLKINPDLKKEILKKLKQR